LGVYELVAQDIRDSRPVAVVTVIVSPDLVGEKMLVYEDGRRVGSLGNPAIDDLAAVDAADAIRYERVRTQAYDIPGSAGRQVTVFLEPHVPPPSLVIIGAGHTSIPLAAMGRIAGFKVTLIDARAAFATNERFKDVDEIIVEWPHRAMAERPISSSTYIAVLTHDPKFEEPLLPILIRSDARYIGVIGSRKTQVQRRERLRAEGFTDADLARLSGPIGLDIGAVSPEEIAISILAEIVAKRHGRSGGFLGEKSQSARV
jgi:xanthine dehydrogenase accessory factor